MNLETQMQDSLEIFWNPFKEEYCFYAGDIVWRYDEQMEEWESIGIVDFIHRAPYTKYYEFICEVKA